MPKYFVTKYATTDGKIITVNDGRSPGDDGGISLKLPGHMWNSHFKLGRDVFTDAEDAKAAVRAARDKRIASLEKQIAKLRKMEPVIQ